MNKKIYLVLNGGIGNQMFGIAAALSESEDIVIVGKISNYSQDKNGRPEILSLMQEPKIQYIEPHVWLLPILRKLYNYLLVSKLGVRNHWSIFFYSPIYWVLSTCLNVLNSRKIKIHVSSDIGFSDISSTTDIILIGYFQSYRWLDEKRVQGKLQSQFFKIEANKPQLFHRVKQVKPIVVHVRLGDYRKEVDFGLLTGAYYQKALAKITEEFPNSPIWVFSDEPKACKIFINEEFHHKVNWISEEYDLSALETLALMRYGVGYVIANSTFSWWAASLAVEPDIPVYWPTPWFSMRSMPRDLIPGTWHAINR